MRRTLSSLALAVALNAGIVAPAYAGGDWEYGNDVGPYGVVTPVPAPVWVPVYSRWYILQRPGSQPILCEAGSRHHLPRGYKCQPQRYRYR